MKKKSAVPDPHGLRYKRVGLNIAFHRKMNGLTQAQLAEMTDLSTAYISQIETNRKVNGVSLKALFDIADAFKIKPSKLLDFDE